MTESLDILAIVAHPDDAELICGATLILAAAKGERTGVLDLSAGELGSRGTAEVRAREAERAAEVMGLVVRRCAGLGDGHLENTHEARRQVAGIVRELRPRVVITHWTNGRHPDHRAAAALAYDASFLAGLVNYPAEGTAFRPSKVVHATSFREDAGKPTFVVDVSEHLERKIEALACYESQFAGAKGIGEIFPGGDRSLFDQVRAHAAHAGSLIRVRYGEPFWTRETMRVESPTEIDVSTF